MAPKKPRRWRKDFPYYKVQVFSDVSISWMDEPLAYDSAVEAEEAIRRKFATQQARIVVVEREGRHVLESSSGE